MRRYELSAPMFLSLLLGAAACGTGHSADGLRATSPSSVSSTSAAAPVLGTADASLQSVLAASAGAAASATPTASPAAQERFLDLDAIVQDANTRRALTVAVPHATTLEANGNLFAHCVVDYGGGNPVQSVCDTIDSILVSVTGDWSNGCGAIYTTSSDFDAVVDSIVVGLEGVGTCASSLVADAGVLAGDVLSCVDASSGTVVGYVVGSAAGAVDTALQGAGAGVTGSVDAGATLACDAGGLVGTVVGGAGEAVGTVIGGVGAAAGGIIAGCGAAVGTVIDTAGAVIGSVADCAGDLVGGVLTAIGGCFGSGYGAGYGGSTYDHTAATCTTVRWHGRLLSDCKHSAFD